MLGNCADTIAPWYRKISTLPTHARSRATDVDKFINLATRGMKMLYRRLDLLKTRKTYNTFNLNNSTYRPFTKPNTTLQYVHRESNHPPITTKNIPAGINRRLSSLSSDKASFDQATPPPYQKALDESGYHYTLHYEPSTTAKRRNRQRNKT